MLVLLLTGRAAHKAKGTAGIGVGFAGVEAGQLGAVGGVTLAHRGNAVGASPMAIP